MSIDSIRLVTLLLRLLCRKFIIVDAIADVTLSSCDDATIAGDI